MLPTLVRRSARAHTPLIHFLGKRQWPSHAEAPHPHPFAPPEIKQAFGEFLSKSQPSSTASKPTAAASKSSSGAQVHQEFWHAPERLWRHDIGEAEIEAILSGGASSA